MSLWRLETIYGRKLERTHVWCLFLWNYLLG